MTDFYFWAIAALAVFLVGLSKSGFLVSIGLVGVPLLSLVMPARDAAGMMLPLLLIMDAVAVWNYRKDADWHILRILISGALVGTILGWVLWTVVSDAAVLLFVGLFTLIFVADAVLPIRKKIAENLPPSRPWGLFWGAFAGFTSFISHTGGPLFQIYVLPQRLTPVRYSGTSAFFFAIINASKLIPYYFLGQLNVSNLTHATLLVPIGVFGVVAGVWMTRRVSTRWFYAIAYTLVAVVAAKLVYDGIIGVFFAVPAAT